MRAWWLMLALAGGCGVPQEEHDKVVAERDALKAKVKEAEEAVDKARAEAKQARSKLDESTASSGRPDPAQIVAARATLKLAPDQDIKAVFKTNMGDITCKLWPDIAPQTVMNFVGLAEGTKEWTDPSGAKVKKPLYDGTKFHRVIKGFMIQGGDPLGNGTGGPGYKFGDEVWPDVRFSRPGLLAMANAGPSTNGSQFFITTGTPAHLNMRHTLWGECDLETVNKISDVEVGGPQKSTPAKDVVIEKVSILREAKAIAGQGEAVPTPPAAPPN